MKKFLLVILMLTMTIPFVLSCGDDSDEDTAASAPLEVEDPPADDPCDIASCDMVVCENISFASFETDYLQTASPNDTICIAPGYTVTNTSHGKMSITTPGLTIVGDDDDDTIEFANSVNTNNANSDDDSVFFANGVTDLTFKDLTISMAGQEGRAIWFDGDSNNFLIDNVRIEGSQSTDFNEPAIGIYIDDSSGTVDGANIYCNSSGPLTCAGIFVVTNAAGTRAVTVTNSTIETYFGYGLRLTGSTGTTNVTLSNSNILANSSAVYTDIYNSTLAISGSTLVSNSSFGAAVSYRNITSGSISNSILRSTYDGTSYGVLNFVANQGAKTITMTGSTIESGGAYAVKFGTFALGVHNLNASNTIFKRKNSGGTSREAIFFGASNHALDSTSNGNTFCYENVADTFTSVIGGTHSGNFVIANQVNAGAIGVCP